MDPQLLFWPLDNNQESYSGNDRSRVFHRRPEPDRNEVVIFEGFFTIGLRMPPHPVLADILLKYQVQLHQLTANAIAQLSNYVWAVASFGGVLSVNGFAKRYELHYHLKKMNVDGAKVQA
jgi:hypothetical protein